MKSCRIPSSPRVYNYNMSVSSTGHHLQIVSIYSISLESHNMIHNNTNAWLFGDFELPKINWQNNTLTAGGRHATTCQLLLEMVQDLFPLQFKFESSRQKNILDLAVTSNISVELNVEVKASFTDCNIVKANVDFHFVRLWKQNRWNGSI